MQTINPVQGTDRFLYELQLAKTVIPALQPASGEQAGARRLPRCSSSLSPAAFKVYFRFLITLEP